MATMIIAALALTLFQLWILPAGLAVKDLSYLLSSRDDTAPEQSVLQGRVARAGDNLRQSLPAFLALCLLAMIQQVDLSQLAMIWIGLRVLFLLCYMFNIVYVRTLIWLGSIICMVMMALKLV